jgi:phosphopantothenoylcysteine decarboxylase/phosphopantothenate--cysteine ligase
VPVFSWRVDIKNNLQISKQIDCFFECWQYNRENMSILTNIRIVLGITGSIAAYKAADLASKLTQTGALVDAIITPAGEKFISPLTIQSVTGRKAYLDADLWGGDAHILHVGLGQSANLLVVAPCTANTLAKLAHGIADNLLTITALAARCPLLVAPAMDVGIFTHPASQENIRLLTEHGTYIAGPGEGRMASGLVGMGRFLEPSELLGHIRLLLGRNGPLFGKKIVVTAGGTQEPLDPVRVLTNRSSGKQGYALAQAAIDAGASVVLVTAPTALTPPVGAKVIAVNTAQQMLDAVLSESDGAEALLMAAAVADFRPKVIAENKLKKHEGIPQVDLEAAPDVLQAVADLGPKKPQVVVGFAAESRNMLMNALSKLKSKQLDMIAANDISVPDSGFGVDTNRITLLFPDGSQEPLPLMSKTEAAETIIARMAVLLESK